jgi:hypothetical protein
LKDRLLAKRIQIPSKLMLRVFDTNWNNFAINGPGVAGITGNWPQQLQFAKDIDISRLGSGTVLGYGATAGQNWACLNLMSLSTGTGTDYLCRATNNNLTLRIDIRGLVRPTAIASTKDDLGRILVFWDAGKDTPYAAGTAPWNMNELLKDQNFAAAAQPSVYSFKNYDNQNRFKFLRDITLMLPPYGAVIAATPMRDCNVQPYHIEESITCRLPTEYITAANSNGSIHSIQSGGLYIALFSAETLNANHASAATNSTWVMSGASRVYTVSTFS